MRTDNDSWDITTSVGSTALFVAAARALEAQKPDPVSVDQYAEVFCRAVGGRWADIVDGKAPDSRLLRADFGTAFVNFQAARTRYFDDYFAAASAAGVRQIVILAAGLDSRAYRLPWPDGTVIYELDQPKVLEFKREVLAVHGDRPRAGRREIAVDLRDDWPKVLKHSGFDVTQPAAFIVEGLLVYLPASSQGELFAGLDALAAPGSRAAIEEGQPMPDSVYQAAKAAELASTEDGSFYTLIYNEQIAPAADWFGGRGWSAVPTPLGGYLERLGTALPPEGSQEALMVKANTLVSAVKQG